MSDLYAEPTLVGGGTELREMVEYERPDVEIFSHEEIDSMISALGRTPIYNAAAYSGLVKLCAVSGVDGIPARTRRGCQKCDDAIEPGDRRITRFGHFYHPRCVGEQDADDAVVEGEKR